MGISLEPASPEESLANFHLIVVLDFVLLLGWMALGPPVLQSKTSPAVISLFSSMCLLYSGVIDWALHQCSRYHSICFCRSLSLLQGKHSKYQRTCFCDPSQTVYVSHLNRDLQEHLSHRCALVPLWRPEMWPEVWLLDVRGLVSGPEDAGGGYHWLHRQRRVGSRR